MTRTEKDWIFVSDAHFSAREPETMGAFLRFLNREKERISHLVILGDLFEFLFGFKEDPSGGNPFPFPEYLQVLAGLQEAYRRGVRIKYVEGNHDFFLGSFFAERFGMEVEVYKEESEEQLGTKRAYLSHGDLANPALWSHRIFRRMLKNPWTYGIIQIVGPGLSGRVARWLNRRSYEKNHAAVGSGPPPEFRTFARKKFLEGFDIVILGHSHFPEEMEEQTGGRICRYYNVGDWMTHRSFLRFTPPDSFRMGRFKK